MKIIENYSTKMSRRGLGLMSLFFWLYCPLQIVWQIYNIVKYMNGSIVFEAKLFIVHLVSALFFLLIVATAILLDKFTFYTIIAFVSVKSIYAVIDTVITIVQMKKEMDNVDAGFLAGAVAVGTGIGAGWGLFVTAVVILIDLAFMFYVIDHRDIFD